MVQTDWLRQPQQGLEQAVDMGGRQKLLAAGDRVDSPERIVHDDDGVSGTIALEFT